MLPEVEYLGHRISARGLQPTEEKIRAIVKAPPPQDVSQFLGLVNYYGKFLPNLSTLLAPLHLLLRQETKWFWGQEQEEAFRKSKGLLTSAPLLVHYDGNKKIVLSCDASPYGIGAVLSQVMEDDSEQPVAYASRSLLPAEKNYSRLDKEGLALIFGVKKQSGPLSYQVELSDGRIFRRHIDEVRIRTVEVDLDGVSEPEDFMDGFPVEPAVPVPNPADVQPECPFVPVDATLEPARPAVMPAIVPRQSHRVQHPPDRLRR